MKKHLLAVFVTLLCLASFALTFTISGCGNATGGGSSGSSGNPRLYVTDTTNKTVIVFKPGTTETVGTQEIHTLILLSTIELTGAASPKWMALNPNGKKLYVADEGSTKVYVIDTASDSVEATVLTCTTPRGMAFNADATKLFVATPGGYDIAVVDVSSNAREGDIQIPGNGFHDLAYDKNTDKLYVANTDLNSIEVVSAEMSATISDFVNVVAPYRIVLGPKSGSSTYVYTSSYASANPYLSKVNMTSKEVETTWESTGSDSGFHGLVISPDNKKLYAADHDFSYIDVLDLTTGNTQEPINFVPGAANYAWPDPEQIAMYSNGKFAAVLNTYNTKEVVLLDTVKGERVGNYVLPSSTDDYFGIVYKP
jgi:YVTN family beta-propeller protein